MEVFINVADLDIRWGVLAGKKNKIMLGGESFS